MSNIPNNPSRTRILDAAEELFSTRGFASVKLRDIAAVVNMKHASLYYYAPGGKEQLFIEVMERNFERHRFGLTQAIESAEGDIRGQVRAVAEWLVTQPPLDFSRISQADMLTIDPTEAQRLMQLAFDSLRLPLLTALKKASAAGQIAVEDFNLAALALVSLVQSVHSLPPIFSSKERVQVSHQLADMLLNGWLRR